MKSIKIGEIEIGEGCPCFIIAEAGANFRISDNDEANFNQAIKLIDIAKEAGVDAVKFQLYRADKLYVDGSGYADYIGKKKPIKDVIKEMELPYEWLAKLKEYCEGIGIVFLCSPFDEESADELEKIGIAAYKIASYTITDEPLLRYIAKKGKTIILSTGASNIDEIEEAVKIIKEEGNGEVAVMQCTAKYPSPLSSISLKTISFLQEKFNVPVGLSDHSREPLIAPLGAVSLGAKIIEKHFTTDNNLPGPDQEFAILPEELKVMVESIRDLEMALGTEEKILLEDEKELHSFARRYIYAIKDIGKGEKFSAKNIAVLRSGKAKKGLTPDYFDKIIGKKLKSNLKKGAPVEEENIYD
ncbi:N-acetylneuraminate synthase family protein [Candidatus Woesearchaeota archaeon]|nr:N-acetylneuraminate synthase family protein [Candidatus Woesearchaeota archaeon]